MLLLTMMCPSFSRITSQSFMWKLGVRGIRLDWEQDLSRHLKQATRNCWRFRWDLLRQARPLESSCSELHAFSIPKTPTLSRHVLTRQQPTKSKKNSHLVAHIDSFSHHQKRIRYSYIYFEHWYWRKIKVLFLSNFFSHRFIHFDHLFQVHNVGEGRLCLTLTDSTFGVVSFLAIGLFFMGFFK